MHERVVNGYPGGLIMIESQYVIMWARMGGIGRSLSAGGFLKSYGATGLGTCSVATMEVYMLREGRRIPGSIAITVRCYTRAPFWLGL